MLVDMSLMSIFVVSKNIHSLGSPATCPANAPSEMSSHLTKSIGSAEELVRFRSSGMMSVIAVSQYLSPISTSNIYTETSFDTLPIRKIESPSTVCTPESDKMLPS